MGKSRGRGRGRGRGGGRGGNAVGSDDDNFDYKPERVGGQSATAGLLPPSDSEDDEDSEKEKQPKRGQNPRAGELPPSDSDEDESSSSEEDGSEDADEPAPPKAAPAPAAPRRKKDEEVDPEQMAADMERLALIRQKREEDRLRRIQEEGFDRYAPPGESNKRPDGLPSDHPTRKAGA